MRLVGLSLALSFLVAACGQSLQPLRPFDSGLPVDDLAIGRGDGGVVDLAGSGPIDLAGADFAGSEPDTSGPVITYVKPLAGVFVGGLLEVIVTATDPSGINPSTVKVIIAHDPNNTLPLTPNGSTDQFHAFFDLKTLGTTSSFLDLDVVADDKLANHSELGEEVLLDNTPPWMTMNAAVTMRVGTENSTDATFMCSQPFGPLGPTFLDPAHDNTPEAAFEGATLKQIMGLRARIEDHGNHAPGQRVDYISDIDESTVTLFAVGIVAPAVTLPVLAVDTDGDGICDDVNPNLVPTSGTIAMPNEALALAMAPLTDGCAPDYTRDATMPAGCGEVGPAPPATPPADPVLCDKGGTLMTCVIPGFGKDKPIYSLPPIHNPDACVGLPLDASNHLPEGPACVLVRAADNAGNHMVSFPLHVCIDLGGTGCSSFVADPTACTGQLMNGMIVAGKHCVAPSVGGNPGTFITDGSEVRDLDIFN